MKITKRLPSLQDLNEDDVMVLDSGDEVYIWVGQGSDDQEKEKAFTMAEVSLFSNTVKEVLKLLETQVLT